MDYKTFIKKQVGLDVIEAYDNLSKSDYYLYQYRFLAYINEYFYTDIDCLEELFKAYNISVNEVKLDEKLHEHLSNLKRDLNIRQLTNEYKRKQYLYWAILDSQCRSNIECCYDISDCMTIFNINELTYDESYTLIKYSIEHDTPFNKLDASKILELSKIRTRDVDKTDYSKEMDKYLTNITPKIQTSIINKIEKQITEMLSEAGISSYTLEQYNVDQIDHRRKISFGPEYVGDGMGVFLGDEYTKSMGTKFLGIIANIENKCTVLCDGNGGFYISFPTSLSYNRGKLMESSEYTNRKYSKEEIIDALKNDLYIPTTAMYLSKYTYVDKTTFNNDWQSDLEKGIKFIHKGSTKIEVHYEPYEYEPIVKFTIITFGKRNIENEKNVINEYMEEFRYFSDRYSWKIKEITE